MVTQTQSFAHESFSSEIMLDEMGTLLVSFK